MYGRLPSRQARAGICRLVSAKLAPCSAARARSPTSSGLSASAARARRAGSISDAKVASASTMVKRSAPRGRTESLVSSGTNAPLRLSRTRSTHNCGHRTAGREHATQRMPRREDRRAEQAAPMPAGRGRGEERAGDPGGAARAAGAAQLGEGLGHVDPRSRASTARSELLRAAIANSGERRAASRRTAVRRLQGPHEVAREGSHRGSTGAHTWARTSRPHRSAAASDRGRRCRGRSAMAATA